jgi:hypothetical protein
MNWTIVGEWLKHNGHIDDNWERLDITEDSIYAEDSFENTFISIFTRGENELVLYVGCLQPKISVGSGTGYRVSSCWDVIDFLEDHLEDMYNELTKKFVEVYENV